MKMPEPITAPIPRAVRLQGPRVLASRLPGSCDAAISASMLLVRSRDIRSGFRISDVPATSAPDTPEIRNPTSEILFLPFALALGRLSDLLLQRSARYSGGALGL